MGRTILHEKGLLKKAYTPDFRTYEEFVEHMDAQLRIPATLFHLINLREVRSLDMPEKCL